MKPVWGRRRKKLFLFFLRFLSETICELFAKISRKIVRERVPPSTTRKKGTKRWRLHRQLCVRVFQLLEGWNSHAHDLSKGFRTSRPPLRCARRAAPSARRPLVARRLPRRDHRAVAAARLQLKNVFFYELIGLINWSTSFDRFDANFKFIQLKII